MRQKIAKLILIGLVVVLALAACSDNPAVRVRYEAEKILYRADRLARESSLQQQSPGSSLDDPVYVTYDSTVLFCYDALKQFPASDFPVENRELAAIAYRAANRMVGATYAREHFDSCVALLERMLTNIPLDRLGTVTTYLNLGSALQATDQWDSALTVFNFCLNNFYPPVDDRGEVVINLLNLPTRIYDVYLTIGDTATAMRHSVKAEGYYRKLVADYAGTTVASAGHLNLASLYERLERWDEAVAELAFLSDTGSATETSARLRTASIQASHLDRPDLAIEEYDQILRNLKGRDTLSRPTVMFNKGLVYLHQARYPEARQTLNEVKRRYPRFFERMPTVQFAIARTFELQDNWDRAETEYRFLINNFPTSEQSLSTYLYLIDRFAAQNRTTEADRMEIRAEAVYEDIAADHVGTPAEATALSYKAELLRRRKQWQPAANLLTDIFDRFPTTEVGFRNMVTAAVIYRDNLGQPRKADSLIQELKRRLTTVDEPGEF